MIPSVLPVRFGGTGPDGKPSVLIFTASGQVDYRFKALEKDSRLQVLGTAHTPEALFVMLPQLKPDVVVVNTRIDNAPHGEDELRAVPAFDLLKQWADQHLGQTPLGVVALKMLSHDSATRLPQAKANPFNKVTFVSLYEGADEITKAILGADPTAKAKDA